MTHQDEQRLARIGVLLPRAGRTEPDELKRALAAELAELGFYATGAKDLVRVGSSTGVTRPLALASYVLGYSERHGSTEAIAALEDWITTDTIDTHAYAYVENASTDSTIILAPGVSIIPESSAPSEMRRSIAELAGPLKRIGCLIEVVWTGSPFIESKSKDRSEDHLLDDYDLPPWLEPIDTALKVIAVATPANPAVRLSGAFYFGERLRLLEGTGGFSGLFPEHAPWQNPRPLPQKDLSPLWHQYCGLSETDRRRVDVAIERLSLATARQRPGDALVEAAISLEAVLSDPDNREELTYRLRLRAALLLGTTPDARRRIKDTVRDLYKERSAVVHGLIPRKNDARLRWQAENLAQRLLLHILERGSIPNWQELELFPPPL